MNAGLLLPDWPAALRVRACVSLRHADGVSQPPFDRFNLGAACGDDPAAVAENRRRLQALAGLPGEPHWLRQVHGTAVARFGEAAWSDLPPEADAAVTDQPGCVLAILTADCLPVLFAAKHGREVAAAHAGWRGLCAGVLENTLAKMRTSANDVIAWLGPAAGPSAYEVGEEVRDAFLERDPAAAAAFVPTRPGHWLCDLYALARQRLRAVGVDTVAGGEHCTIIDPRRFYSHRRDGRSGRMASLLWIDPA